METLRAWGSEGLEGEKRAGDRRPLPWTCPSCPSSTQSGPRTPRESRPLSSPGHRSWKQRLARETWEERLQGCLSGTVLYQLVIHAPE